MTVVFQKVLYFLEYDLRTPTVPPVFLLKGQPAPISEELYQAATACDESKNHFTCPRCGKKVMCGSLPGDRNHVQLCRCFVVGHYTQKTIFSTEGWQAIWQAYEVESLRPAPDNSIEFDPISGAPMGVTQQSKDWFAQKLGFHRPIKINQDGDLIETTGASIHINPETKTISALSNLNKFSPEEMEDFVRAYKLKAGGGPPPILIIVGDDPDYVWPPETKDIRPLSFSCPNCKKTVHQGRLDQPAFDRILCCYCMSLFVRKGSLGPKSSADWQQCRETARRGQFTHRAVTADGKS
jgi:hypothetical protein